MSNIINSNAYVKQGDKVYKMNGGAGSPIHTFNSVEEMNAANLADGSIACVPSSGESGGQTAKVIDLTKYTQVTQGSTMSHNDAILTLFSQNGGNLSFVDNTAFWADLDTDKPIKFLLDLSLLFEDLTFECSANSLLKNDGEIFQVDSSFLLALNGSARVTILIHKSVFNDEVSTIIDVLIEQIKSS